MKKCIRKWNLEHFSGKSGGKSTKVVVKWWWYNHLVLRMFVPCLHCLFLAWWLQSFGLDYSVSVRVCLDLLIQLFPTGSVPFTAVQTIDSGSEWLCCGRRPGAGSAGRSESGGRECRHGGVLSQVWYVWLLLMSAPIFIAVMVTTLIYRVVLCCNGVRSSSALGGNTISWAFPSLTH